MSLTPAQPHIMLQFSDKMVMEISGKVKGLFVIWLLGKIIGT
jgi:hypothetical protein